MLKHFSELVYKAEQTHVYHGWTKMSKTWAFDLEPKCACLILQSQTSVWRYCQNICVVFLQQFLVQLDLSLKKFIQTVSWVLTKLCRLDANETECLQLLPVIKIKGTFQTRYKESAATGSWDWFLCKKWSAEFRKCIYNTHFKLKHTQIKVSKCSQ